jgi:hypothetical protein
MKSAQPIAYLISRLIIGIEWPDSSCRQSHCWRARGVVKVSLSCGGPNREGRIRAIHTQRCPLSGKDVYRATVVKLNHFLLVLVLFSKRPGKFQMRGPSLR